MDSGTPPSIASPEILAGRVAGFCLPDESGYAVIVTLKWGALKFHHLTPPCLRLVDTR
jgi:hypothetical protein